MKRTTTVMLTVMTLADLAALAVPADARPHAKLPGEKPGVAQRGLQCTPRLVRPGDTLTIRFPARHGGDFSVGSPRDELFSVAFRQPDRASAYQPVITEDRFKTMTALTVKVADFRGFPSYKPGPPRAIFRENGTYTLLVSPALETEAPVIQGWCKIRFRR